MNIHRRSLIGGVGATAGVVSLAGCVSPFRDRPPVVTQVHATNYFKDPAPLRVMVERDGETVYDQTRRVPGVNQGEEGVPGGTAFQVSEEQNPMVIRVSIPESDLAESLDTGQLRGAGQIFVRAVMGRTDYSDGLTIGYSTDTNHPTETPE